MGINNHPCWNNISFIYADDHVDIHFLGITLLTLECERSGLSDKNYYICSFMDAMFIYKMAIFLSESM